MVCNLAVEIAIYNFDLFHTALMDNGTLFVDVVDMRSKTRNCILKKIMKAKDGLLEVEAQPD